MLIFMDGFDKYGGVNTAVASVAALMAGEWNTISNANIAAPLSVTGQAIQQAGSSAFSVGKTFTAVGRIIGGVRFSATLGNTAQGIQFTDSGAANQCGILIASTGVLTFRNGAYSTGTIIGTSGTSISANTTHYLEWDITLGNAAAYNIYLDGVSIISGTGDTTATANNNIGGIFLCGASGTNSITFDDFYLFDTTGTRNNAVLLTSPRIETTFPSSDSAVQFAFGAAVLGNTVQISSATTSGFANNLVLRRFVPSRSCTLNSIGLLPAATSGTSQWRGVVYADSGGVAGTLMSAGSTVVGATGGTVLTMPLTTPQSLTAGTPYWLGYMSDTTVSQNFADGANNCVRAPATFSSGAPGTAPAMTTGQPTQLFWGNISGTGANYYEVNQQPPAGAFSYVTDTTVGHEDLYGFPALSAMPGTVYTAAVKGYCSKSDTGARTVSLRMSSGGTDSGGSSLAPGTTYGWLGANFETDPNGGVAWTGANLNAATSGFKIDA
jgi:hypothetical protein